MKIESGTLRTVVFIGGLFCIAMGKALGADGADENVLQYEIESKIFAPNTSTIRASDGTPSISLADFKTDALSLGKDGSSEIQFMSNVEFTVGDVRVVMKRDSLTWNGKPDPDPEVIPCLTSPRLRTVSGQMAKMQVGSDVIQYFERTPDGLFELKTKQAFTGYTVSCTATPAQGDNANLKWSLETHRVKERTPIPGVSLDIGDPVIQSQRIDSDVEVKLGEWGCFAQLRDIEVNAGEWEAGAQIGVQGPLLIFIRVTEVSE